VVTDLIPYGGNAEVADVDLGEALWS
jgi:hypothetical protein